jgi:phage gpG-like protein
VITPEEFALKLAAAADTVKPRLEIGLDKVGELAETMAASYPGTYQTGWPRLAESTLEKKGADTPLLETGEMRDSIERDLDPIEMKVVIGSKSKIALYQELGTSRIPPRPFLSLAMHRAMPFAAETFRKIAATILRT